MSSLAQQPSGLTSSPVCLVRLHHEAEVASPGVADAGVSSARHSGLEVLLGESIVDLVLETVVAAAVVRAAHPDLGGREGEEEEKRVGWGGEP